MYVHWFWVGEFVKVRVGLVVVGSWRMCFIVCRMVGWFLCLVVCVSWGEFVGHPLVIGLGCTMGRTSPPTSWFVGF